MVPKEGAVRRREFVLVVAFPIGCFLAVERVAVEGGSPVKTSSMGPRRSAFRLLDGGQIKGKSQSIRVMARFIMRILSAAAPYGRPPGLAEEKGPWFTS